MMFNFPGHGDDPLPEFKDMQVFPNRQRSIASRKCKDLRQPVKKKTSHAAQPTPQLAYHICMKLLQSAGRGRNFEAWECLHISFVVDQNWALFRSRWGGRPMLLLSCANWELKVEISRDSIHPC
jgi:hypothetical protein